MEMFWVMLIKPFVGAVVFGFAYVVASFILRLIPHGRIRRLLTRQIGVKSANPRRYERWQ